MIRVAFTLIGGKNWIGGYNYLLNLVRALSVYRPDAITPVLFFGEDIVPADAVPFEQIAGVEVVRHAAFDEMRKKSALIRSMVFGRDKMVQSLFNKLRIDVVFECAQFNGWRLEQPAIAWIPDFQHRALPHLFTKSAYLKREIGLRAQVISGRTIMLSSEDSRKDCERFYPSAVGRTQVVSFAVPATPRSSTVESKEVTDKYELPAKYFFMPNQFWQHKNHLLVAEALSLLKARGRDDVVVVTTGRTSDPRLPQYFSNLQTLIAERGIEKQFRILGLVPYGDLAPLMQASEALVNPSLFEGWSTTVEEAKAAGVPMLLSDLDVHREQAQGLAQFFDRYSASSLAEALIGDFFKDTTSDECLASAAQIRMKNFADTFVLLVQTAAKVH